MTFEQYKMCRSWEKVLKNAVNLDFIHLSTGDFAKIAKIYNEVFASSLSVSQMNCNSCRLTALKKLGKEFFYWKPVFDKKIIEEKEKEKEEQKEQEQKEQQQDEVVKTKKKGRPRKIDI